MSSKFAFRKRLPRRTAAGTRIESPKRRLLLEALCDRRVLATVSGAVFDDLNDTWRQDEGEAALEGRLVFVDDNNNGLPDDGERFVLTDVDGNFALEELGTDDQIIRLFNAAPSQLQLFPIHPDPIPGLISTPPLEKAATGHAMRVSPSGDRAAIPVDSGVVIVDLAERFSTPVDLGGAATAAEFLADGRLLVLASDASGNHAFLIDTDGFVSPIQLHLPPMFGEGGDENGEGDDHTLPEDFTGWAAIAIDASGNGVLLPQGDESPVSARRVSADSQYIGSFPTESDFLPATTLTGGGSLTTVIAQPLEQGIALSLWSNSTGTLISEEPVAITEAHSVLAYSDTTDLVFAAVSGEEEGDADSILVLDAADNFATLQRIEELDDLVAIDVARSVVFSLSTETFRLRAIDALSAETIADWLLPLELPGEPIEMTLNAAGKQLLVLGSTGVAAIALDRIDAHRVTLDGSVPQYPLRFAARATGENAPPQFTQPLEFEVIAGRPLVLPAGGLLQGAVDPDGDPFVIIRNSSPAGGTVSITPQGAMTYTPASGFSGTDSFEVFLHDGRAPSAIATVQLNVVVPEPGVTIQPRPVPENARPGFIAGEIETIGFGEGPPVFIIEDPRFIVEGDFIVVAEGASFDSEVEGVILTTITVSDQEGETELIEELTIEITEPAPLIEDIQPQSASVFENVPGELIAELMVVSDNPEQPYFLSVDDDRFEIVVRSLRLKPGIALDHEAESTVVVNITATDAMGSGDTLTVPLTITVLDVAEQAQSIELTGTSVVEFVRGAEVGSVIIDGNPAGSSYTVWVDDSRFEVVGGVLRLRADEFLSRADQEEAIVIISVQDVGQVFAPVAQSFAIEVLVNENPFHNPDNPFDVNGDGQVTPLDALLILNAISRNGGGGPISEFPPPGRYWDVNGDGMITPLDALLILNFINRQNRQGVSEPESTQEDTAAMPTSPDDSLHAQTISQPERDAGTTELPAGDRLLLSERLAPGDADPQALDTVFGRDELLAGALEEGRNGDGFTDELREALRRSLRERAAAVAERTAELVRDRTDAADEALERLLTRFDDIDVRAELLRNRALTAVEGAVELLQARATNAADVLGTLPDRAAAVADRLADLSELQAARERVAELLGERIGAEGRSLSGTLTAGIDPLRQRLLSMLTSEDWQTLNRWNSAVSEGVLTEEMVARIETALDRINAAG